MSTKEALSGLLAGLLLALSSTAGAAVPDAVKARLATQNALFDEYYETELKHHPEMATAYGDYRYNDQLTDHSLEAIAGRNQIDKGFLKRLQSIGTDGFSDQDRLSHDLLERVLARSVNAGEAQHGDGGAAARAERLPGALSLKPCAAAALPNAGSHAAAQPNRAATIRGFIRSASRRRCGPAPSRRHRVPETPPGRRGPPRSAVRPGR